MKRIIRTVAIALVLGVLFCSSAMASNQETIWNYFKGKGFTDAGVAGIMGNLEAESSYLSNNLENAAKTRSGYSDEQFTAAVDSGAVSRSPCSL